MRSLLPLVLLLGCNTPGTFGSALFGSDEPEGPTDAEMIAQLEAEPVASPPPERALADVPALPTNTWLQVFDRSARITHRLLDDGRYLVQVGDGDAQEMPVISQHEPESRLLSDPARERIAESLDAVRFQAVAPHIPDVEVDPDQSVHVLQLRPLAITVRDTHTGRVHTVHVSADARVPATFGPLAPVWRVLDAEVFGRWLQAAVQPGSTGGPAG